MSKRNYHKGNSWASLHGRPISVELRVVHCMVTEDGDVDGMWWDIIDP